MFSLRRIAVCGRSVARLESCFGAQGGLESGARAKLSGLRWQSTGTVSSSVGLAGKKPMVVDKELPDPFKGKALRRANLIIYILSMCVGTYLVINYEKINSPIVSTTMHFLRRSKIIREELGDGIDFLTVFPWIQGKLNQVQGEVDINFKVGGSKNTGTIRLLADRDDRQKEFLIHEWSLTVGDKKFDLLEDKTVEFIA